MNRLRWAFLATMAAGILLVVMLPNTALAWLRSEYGWLGRSVNWVEALQPALDTVHILLFGVLGMLTRLALPRTPWRHLILGLTVFSAATEVLQFWAPGRTARLSDFLQDVLGAGVGLVLVALPQALWSRWQRRKESR